MTEDPALTRIRSKVEAATARNAQRLGERAAQVRDEAAALVGEHPFAAVASGIAFGLLIGALIPKRKASAKAGALAGIVAEAALDLARKSWESASDIGRAGQHGIEHLGGRVSDGTAGLRREIGRVAENAADNLRSAGKQASQQAKSVTEKIGTHLRH